MRDFGEFLASIFGSWQNWASGGGFGGAVVVLYAVFQALTGRSLSPRTYALIFLGGFLLCSFFRVWRDQFTRANEMAAKLSELTLPKLTGSVGFISSARSPRNANDSVVTIIANIENSGAPSIVKKLGLRIEFPDKPVVEGTDVDPGGITLLGEGMEPRVFAAADALIRRATVQPIPTNGMAVGYAVLLFAGVSPDAFHNPQNKIILWFEDAKGIMGLAPIDDSRRWGGNNSPEEETKAAMRVHRK